MQVGPVSSDVDIVMDRVRNLKRKADKTIQSLLTGVSDSKIRRCSKDTIRLDQYKRMIHTYDSVTWAGTSITPRDLVAHGWISIGRSIVKCELCSAVVSTDLPSITKVDVNVYSKCLRKLRLQLKDAHDITCEHKVKSTVEYPLIKNFEELNHLMNKEITTIIASVNMVFDNELVDLKDRFPQYEANLLFSVLLNWETKDDMLHCDLCNRRVLVNKKTNFNPVSSHFSWCPSLDKDLNGERKFLKLFKQPHAQTTKSLLSRCMAAKRQMSSALSLIAK